jgi:hypothetical protein
MKARYSLLLAALCCFTGFTPLRAQSTAFTYQGRLATNNTPANGRYDMRFAIFDAPSGGSFGEGDVTLPSVGVTNGLFTVQIELDVKRFSGHDRWLDIAVRPAGGSTFTTLTPRQPITPTPYALTALNVPGISGSSLNAANDGPLNVVMVDNVGKVGVGTTSPASQLHVASKPNELPPRLQSTGNADFSAGWDFYHGATGKGYVGVPGESAGIARGELILFGGQDTRASLWAGGVRGLTVHPSGAVGVGTSIEPLSRFEVNGDVRVRDQLIVDGDVRVGPSGRYRAASGEENLRIVRGYILKDGSIAHGSGFQVSRPGKGRFDITFVPPFAGPPVFTATTDYQSYSDIENVSVLTFGAPRVGGVSVVVQYPGGTFEDADFGFIAIGPR